jgi:hypothetical protein
MKCKCGYEWSFTGKSSPRCPKCKSRKVTNPGRASLVGFHLWAGRRLSRFSTGKEKVELYREYLKSLGRTPSF